MTAVRLKQSDLAAEAARPKILTQVDGGFDDAVVYGHHEEIRLALVGADPACEEEDATRDAGEDLQLQLCALRGSQVRRQAQVRPRIEGRDDVSSG